MLCRVSGEKVVNVARGEEEGVCLTSVDLLQLQTRAPRGPKKKGLERLIQHYLTARSNSTLTSTTTCAPARTSTATVTATSSSELHASSRSRPCLCASRRIGHPTLPDLLFSFVLSRPGSGFCCIPAYSPPIPRTPGQDAVKFTSSLQRYNITTNIASQAPFSCHFALNTLFV